MKKHLTFRELVQQLTQTLEEHPEIAGKLVVIAEDDEYQNFHGLYNPNVLIYDEEEVQEVIWYSNGIKDGQQKAAKDVVILG